MIPYPRNWPNKPNTIQIEAMDLTQTPYKPFQSSGTDNASFAIDGPSARDISTAYRYSAPVFNPSELYKSIFCPASVKWMSEQITARLNGVHPEGKRIVVPDKSILSVIDSYYNNGKFMDVDLVRKQTIMHIVETIKNEMEVETINNGLSIWNTIFTPDTGLTQMNDVKLNERRPTLSWAWNY